jgi:hypothetical protein
MHPLADAIDQFVAECQVYGFGKPVITFPTWEDGMVLMIRSGLSEDAATPIAASTLSFVMRKVIIAFPTRESSREVSAFLERRANNGNWTEDI